MNIHRPHPENLLNLEGLIFSLSLFRFYFQQFINAYFTLLDTATSEVVRGSDCLYEAEFCLDNNVIER